ncbi:Tyrosine recombinase XerC [Pseudovibrio axinellae]|uniref:Tyrosine recombinase XerC n=1 Tax=Pseudovibrio axinellae TaxID=989403 RepID=A0A165XE75_9HYPH|nr:tyrosine-type recombinase/integrase [Pseudovibrio axinellae]KZL17622.1 Tyrosine recombinase XerC [Pseudovibrio axinellae]SER45951.1 Site-specific recombinase XerD [Pseudovibrio axinellae]
MSVFRFKDNKGNYKSKEFYYDFQWHGRRYYGSTGKTKKREAENVEKLVRDKLKTPVDITRIDDAFDQFWEEKAKHQSDPSTLSWRMQLLQDNLIDILDEDRLPFNLAEIRTKHLSKYVAKRRDQPNKRNRLPAPATINREIQLLRTIMNYAYDIWETDLKLPSFGKVLLSEPQARVVEVTKDEQSRIKEHLREDFHDLLDFLIYAGPRASNVMVRSGVVLRDEHIDFVAMVMKFYVKSKLPGGREIAIPITSPMAAILSNNIGNHPDAVFTYIAQSTRNGRERGKRYPITHGAFYSYFKAAAKKIGNPKLRVHDLRHTAATRTLRATRNLLVARDLLGHTRSSTTEKYAHLMTDDLRVQLEQAHSETDQAVESLPKKPSKKTLKGKRRK